ncbi:MAG TPA: site-2 protease family protein [Gemmatimonadaceae bacterium]|nr:site-2 protease family protein [Gemmatimonadaceae bacterium]
MDQLQSFLLVAPVLLFSLVAHEYAHGYAAFRQGDMTAYQLGQLTWNPRPYIDPVGTIIVPIITYLSGFPFGWARSAPINSRNFRHFKRGDIIVSLAGVTANFLVAIVAALLVVVVGWMGRALPQAAETLAYLQVMLRMGVLFNLILVSLNLVPIPPTDGSRVFRYLLPPKLAIKYARIGNVGFALVFLAIWFPPTARVIFAPAMYANALLSRLFAPFVLPVS